MIYLNLDPNFNPFYNEGTEAEFESSIFQGGEVNVRIGWVYKDSGPITITHRVNSSDDLMKVLLSNDALRRKGFKEIHLYMPYLPYARQDRVMVPGEALSIKVFAQLINCCGFASVTILDPHSDVGPALIDNVRIITNHKFVEEAFTQIFLGGANEIAVISPDAGAYKKIFKTCEAIRFNGELVLCNKIRDLKTMEILNISIDGNIKDKTCVVIDDICDGGRTFIEIGKKLKEKGATKVILIATHGIFSYGEEPLIGVIDQVYTTNSFRDFTDTKIITQINI